VSAVEKDATLAVIESEGLQGGIWFRRPTNELEVVAIYIEDGKWVVTSTDERAVEEGRRLFDSEGEAKWVVSSTDERAVEGGKEFFDRESEALESFLERLRAQNRQLKSSRANP
jgi:hypothetical protein